MEHCLGPDGGSLREEVEEEWEEEEEEEEEEEVSLDQNWFGAMLKQQIFQTKENYLNTYWKPMGELFRREIDLNLLKYQNEKTKLLTLESGRLLKARFGKFNELLEGVHKTHRFVLVFDERSRKELRGRCKEVIGGYMAFFKKYSVFQFSKKNQEEYLRYPPIIADAMIDELFVGRD